MHVEQWVAFAESGNQQRITLTDGTVLQGWVMEVFDGGLVFSTGDDRNALDHQLGFDQLREDALFFFDFMQEQWCQYLPD